jgi:LAS superfamily LD-carboxypeptidase LdcB
MNIIGEGFPEEIVEQVKQRQKVYGSGYTGKNRSPEEIVYLNANTSWVKLVSSVNVDDQTIMLNKSLSTIPGIKDNKLAEKFVLFNGTNENPQNQRSGIATNGDLLGNNNTYGIGGTEFGLRPMMGIKRAEIKHENRGSIRRASVQIKAFNRVQFDIIDVLYLRLGFNILLEWGHSMYYDNNGVLQTNSNNSLSNDFLKGKTPYGKFLTKISKQKLATGGNYDAMFAKITNFHWSFLPDGSYDITIDLVSIGDVVESFKINSLIDDRPGAPNLGVSTLDEAIKLINKSTVGRFLYKLVQKSFTSPTKSAVSDDISTSKVDAVYMKFGNLGKQPYIRLGTLLQFFQEKMMYKFVVGDDISPILNFDYETDSNIMFIENDLQVSTDPRVCLVNRIINVGEREFSPFIPYGEPFESPLFNDDVQYGQIMNIYVNMFFILTKMEELKTPDSNKVLLIDFLNNILSSISNSLGGINKLEATLDETINTVIIRDANPLPNIDKVISTLNAIPGKKYNIPNQSVLFDLYGYNRDTASTHASFIKDFSFKTEITPELSTMLTIGATANSKVVGENSTALSKFNAGLTDRFKERVVQSEENFKSNLEKFYEKLSESQELYNKFKTLLKDYASYLIGLSQGKFNPSDAETYKDALTSYLTYYQQYRQAQYQVNYAIKFKKRPPPLFAPNTGFIPFNLSITMDGLSGMKIYSKFLIDVDFLPTNYPENADFLIKGIHHVIENNKWFTTLESMVISKGGTDPSMFGKNKASVRVTGTADSIEAALLLPPPLQNFSPPSNKVGSNSYSFSPLARYIASQGYTNGRLPDNLSLLVVINDNIQKYQQTFKLHPSAAKAYSQWAKAAKSAGFTWTVSNAYRDFAKQASLGKGKTVAGPGSSPHGWAGALDFSELYRAVGGSGKPAINSSVRQTNALYKWMAENGPKFGWYNPYRLADGNGIDEVWHWEYWGNV